MSSSENSAEPSTSRGAGAFHSTLVGGLLYGGQPGF